MTIWQIVDYTRHQPLYTFFTAEYKDQPFNAILDAAGSQDLYIHCPAYLESKGVYVNVGDSEDGGQGETIWRWIKNSTWPRILGGTPRAFTMFGAAVSKEGVKVLAEMAEQGHLRVFVDSVFTMDDALAVSGF